MARPENKDYILQKTFFLLLIKGYDGVSISDIQKETGMSRGIIYHYYENKEELLRAAAEKYLVTPFFISKQNSVGYGISEMIRFVINKYIEITKQWRSYMGSGGLSMANYDFLFYQMIQKDKAIAKAYTRMRREEKVAWTRAINVSLNKGEINKSLSPERMASHFILLLDGLWMNSNETDSVSHSIKQARQVLNDYYELLK